MKDNNDNLMPIRQAYISLVKQAYQEMADLIVKDAKVFADAHPKQLTKQ